MGLTLQHAPRLEYRKSMPHELNVFEGRSCDSSSLNAPGFLLRLWIFTLFEFKPLGLSSWYNDGETSENGADHN